MGDALTTTGIITRKTAYVKGKLPNPGKGKKTVFVRQKVHRKRRLRCRECAAPSLSKKRSS